MKKWRLTTDEKKSISETETWVKDDKTIERETIWRWGAIFIESEDKPEIDLTNSSGLSISEIEYDIELDDLGDGDVDVTYDDDLSDEEQEELDELWDENGDYAWGEAGWELTDSDLTFYGPLVLEEITEEGE